MDEYTQKIIEVMKDQKYLGVLESPTHKFSLKSSECGDWNDIYLNIVEETITDISYENSGCALNIAVLELVCDYLKGERVDSIKELNSSFIRKELDFPSQKEHCLQLVFDTLSPLNDESL